MFGFGLKKATPAAAERLRTSIPKLVVNLGWEYEAAKIAAANPPAAPAAPAASATAAATVPAAERAVWESFGASFSDDGVVAQQRVRSTAAFKALLRQSVVGDAAVAREEAHEAAGEGVPGAGGVEDLLEREGRRGGRCDGRQIERRRARYGSGRWQHSTSRRKGGADVRHAQDHRAAIGKCIHAAEVMPQTEGDPGEFEAAASAAGVLDGVVALVGGLVAAHVG